MTLIQLQNELGKQIQIVTNPNQTKDEFRRNITTATSVATLAERMVRLADIVFRAQYVKNATVLSQEEIDILIGTVKEQNKIDAKPQIAKKTSKNRLKGENYYVQRKQSKSTKHRHDSRRRNNSRIGCC